MTHTHSTPHPAPDVASASAVSGEPHTEAGAAAEEVERLRALLAHQQDGEFTYEPNPNYESRNGSPIQGHIVRFTPHPKTMEDGSERYGFSFPALVASDMLGGAAEVMQSVADQLNACPVIAAELIEARAQLAAMTAERNEWESEATLHRDLWLAATVARDALVGAAYVAAAQTLDTAGDGAVTEALGQRLCCNGHMCGCQGADVGTFLQHLIRALTPADATTSLDHIRAQAKAEGRKDAWAEAVKIAEDTPAWSVRAAIIAAAEKEPRHD